MRKLMPRLLLLLLHTCTGAISQTITIQFTGLRNNQGRIQIQFFDTKEHFDKETPLFTKLASKSSMVNGQLTFTCSGIKPGTYGIAILDDENSNTKMDYGILLPKEGFGFSDYYHTALSKPDFNKFSFNMTSGVRTVRIKVRYL